MQLRKLVLRMEFRNIVGVFTKLKICRKRMNRMIEKNESRT